MKENSPIRKGKDFIFNTARKSVFPSAVGIAGFTFGVQSLGLNYDWNFLQALTEGEGTNRQGLLHTSLIIYGSVFGINAVMDGLIKPLWSVMKEIKKIEALKK